MWISLSTGFLSIVDPEDGGDDLLVRARRKGDIEQTFPGAKVKRTPGRDYLYRAFIDRQVVANTIAGRINEIDYGNFKNSVKDDKLHSAYSRVWGIMSKLQALAPYSSNRRYPSGSLFDKDDF